MLNKRGKRQQFMELLFRQNYNRICEYCYLKLGPPFQDAEDCAMEVFFRAFKRVEELMDHPCPERWLYVTARNVALENIREKRKGGVFEVLDGGELLSQMSGYEKSAEESFFSQKAENTQGAEEEILLGCLKPGEAELYRLLITEKKNRGRIAEELGLTYTNVTTKVYRLKRKLKKQAEKLRKEGRGF